MMAIKKYALLAVGILFLVGALFVGAAALPVVAQGNQGNGNRNGSSNTNANGNANGYGYGYGGMMGNGQVGMGMGMGMGVGTGGMMGGNNGTQTNPERQAPQRRSGPKGRRRLPGQVL